MRGASAGASFTELTNKAEAKDICKERAQSTPWTTTSAAGIGTWAVPDCELFALEM